MRQPLGPEDIVYTDIFDTCSDGEGGLGCCSWTAGRANSTKGSCSTRS